MKNKLFYPEGLHIIVLMMMWIPSINGQEVTMGGMYGGVNRTKWDTSFSEFNPGWMGQFGFIGKAGLSWLQVDFAAEITGKNTGFTQVTTVTDTDQKWVTTYKDVVSNKSAHLTIPVSMAIGYWHQEEDNYEGWGGISVSGGMYVDVGIGGRSDCKVTVTHKSGNQEIVETYRDGDAMFGSSPSKYKRFDAGWQVGVMAGGRVGVGATYRYGLLNLSNVPGYKIYSRTLSINTYIMF